MKKGMNPEAVEQMGTNIEQAGTDAMGEFTKIQGRVQGLDWTGEDRDRFVGDFDSTVQQLAQAVEQACTELGERAKQNATKQRTASS